MTGAAVVLQRDAAVAVITLNQPDRRNALTRELKEALVAARPDRFFVPPYVGGRGWLGVRLDVDALDWDEISEIVTEAYREIAPKKLVTLLDRPRTS